MWHGTKGAVVRTTDSCTYKHETPKLRDRSRKPSNTRGRSTERSGSLKPKGKGKKVCKFWKQGRWDRGAECKVLMRDQLVSQDKPLLPVRLVVKTKINRSMPRTRKGRDPEALAALRALRARSPQSLKDLGTAYPNHRLLPFALLHPCLHPCLRHFASLSQESFVHRFVLTIHRACLL